MLYYYMFCSVQLLHMSREHDTVSMCSTNFCTQSWISITCRAKMMGFNAVRIEWSVDGLAATPKTFSTDSCHIATTADIRSSMLPPTTADTPQPTGTPTLPEDPPTIPKGVCSADLPNTSTQDRYVYLVHYLCEQASISAPQHTAQRKAKSTLVRRWLWESLGSPIVS